MPATTRGVSRRRNIASRNKKQQEHSPTDRANSTAPLSSTVGQQDQQPPLPLSSSTQRHPAVGQTNHSAPVSSVVGRRDQQHQPMSSSLTQRQPPAEGRPSSSSATSSSTVGQQDQQHPPQTATSLSRSNNPHLIPTGPHLERRLQDLLQRDEELREGIDYDFEEEEEEGELFEDEDQQFVGGQTPPYSPIEQEPPTVVPFHEMRATVESSSARRPIKQTPDIFEGFGLDEHKLHDHLRANERIHSDFLAALQALPLLERKDLPSIVDIDRVVVGIDAQIHDFVHTCYNPQDYPLEQRIEGRILVRLRSIDFDLFRAATEKQKADVISAALNQLAFFQEWDCCHFSPLWTKAEQTLVTVVDLVVNSIEDPRDRPEVNKLITGFDYLPLAIKSKLMPQKVSMTLQEQRNILLRKEIAELRKEMERGRRASRQPDLLSGSHILRGVNSPPANFANLLNESQQSIGPSASSNLLVQVEPIPKWNTFTPGEDSHKKLISYVRGCIQSSQELRIEYWPSQLVSHVTTQYGFFKDMTGNGSEYADRFPSSWQEMTPRALLEWLELMWSKDLLKATDAPADFFIAKLSTDQPKIDWKLFKEPLKHPFINYVERLKHEWTQLKTRAIAVPPAREKALVSHWRKVLTHQNVAEKAKNLLKSAHDSALSEVSNFEEALGLSQKFLVTKLNTLQEAADILEPEDTQLSGKKRKQASSGEQASKARPLPTSSSGQSAKKQTPKVPRPPKKNKPVCRRCGWQLRKQNGKFSCARPNCATDPRCNTSEKEWHLTDIAKQWAAQGYVRGLPGDRTVTLKNLEEKRAEWRSEYTWLIQLNKDNSLSNHLISFSVVTDQEHKKRIKITGGPSEGAPTTTGKLLLDSGAIGSCVVSDSFVKKMTAISNCLVFSSVNHELSTALNDHNIISQSVKFSIKLLSEDRKHNLTVEIEALVAPTNIDLIIDKQTIIKNNLLIYFPSEFAHGKLLRDVQSLTKPATPKKRKRKHRDTVSVPIASLGKPLGTSLNAFWVNTFTQKASNEHSRFIKRLRTQKRRRRRKLYRLQSRAIVNLINVRPVFQREESSLMNLSSEESREETIQQVSYLNNLTSNFSTKSAFSREGNLTEIPDNKLESIPAELISSIEGAADYTKVNIFGPPLLQLKLKQLIEEFKDIFRSTVQGEPAQLTPFQLCVDPAKWLIPANRISVRPMDRERAQALDELVSVLLAHNIIEECDESYCSRAFLVPKSNRKWRLVLDFKNLNKATTNFYSWPLPNIQVMLVRVGDSRPQFFAVFDLTSGYYQAPLSVESRKFTAFKTPNGVYRWLRLPMGLTGACSYFQHSLATQVLQGLLHSGVELYLDDCMVHASTVDSFIDRLRKVFLRFRQSKITLNPTKCSFGLPKVEFVGHTIDKDGLHFTRDKLDSVLNFPRPKTKRQIKSFLGLANYFRDHIRNHSIRVEALQQLVANYDKRQARQQIKWSNAAIAAFEDIRQAIDDCPKLWFLDDYSPIFLQTDASDYGIGAYLYQIVQKEDGSSSEHPVGFISKAISNTHANWDTPMKEGYAIFYALQKWEYLLRDRQFSVLTDHKNLTLLRADHFESNKMVKRWFMAYQEYDIINWEYRKGADNEVPDALSRLCPNTVKEHPAVHLYQLTGIDVPPKEWDLIKRYHNSLDRGHGGVTRTLTILQAAEHYWPNMHKHVREFIRLCPCCQKMDQMKKVIHSYPFTTSSYGLWHTVSVDFIERLQTDDYGYMGIIVIVDNFSRFTDMYPVTALNAEQAADALLSFSGRYATPTAFCTDSGATFKNLIIAGLAERLGVDHVLTIAYSKEQNAIVERQNKEVLRHLRNIIMDRRVARKWSKYLPLVQRIINSSVNASTGLAPAQIVFPNGITMDRGLLTEAHPIFLSSYIRDMQDAQARIIALCEETLRNKDDKHMTAYPPQRTTFEEGTYVLAEHRHNSMRRGPKSKLLPFLRGPLLVKASKDKGIYVLQDIVSQKLCDYHVSKLRPFRYDPNTLNPLDVAVTDLPDEFVVEACLGIRGNLRGPKSLLEFNVRWLGYGPDDDTWEPWKAVRDNEVILSWLASHANPRIRRLVPKSYVPPENREEQEESSDDESDSD